MSRKLAAARPVAPIVSDLPVDVVALPNGELLTYYGGRHDRVALPALLDRMHDARDTFRTVDYQFNVNRTWRIVYRFS